MLYSYLLTRTEFKIDQAPETTSRDKQFGYAVYLDLLLLLLECSGVSTMTGEKKSSVRVDSKLSDGKLAKAISADPIVNSIIFKNKTDIDALRPLAQHLHDKIVESSVFTDFKRKRKHELSDEVNMWITVIESIFAKDADLDAAMRSLPNYSNVGFGQGINELVATLKSYYGATAGYVKAGEQLKYSLDKAYELYHSIFVLMIELTREQERRLETAKTKHLATADERNPNMRFVNNSLIARLAECPDLQGYLDKNHVTWETDLALINSLLNQIIRSKQYQEYMDAECTDYSADCEFWRNILRTVIFPSDDLAEALEDKSIFWNDDLPIMGTFVMKTIKQSEKEPDKAITLLPQYKDEEDANFGAELFVDSVKNRDRYREMIDNCINTGNWDPDRIAFMDIIIMTVAISELLNYPNIPLAVTMNEYIEIANSYSSPRSGQFINGLLYSVVNTLREEGKIMK